jgi:hypothetical protein
MSSDLLGCGDGRSVFLISLAVVLGEWITTLQVGACFHRKSLESVYMNATQIYVRTEDIQVLYRYVYILYDTAEEMSMIVK